jgi:hypothetical protein
VAAAARAWLDAHESLDARNLEAFDLLDLPRGLDRLGGDGMAGDRQQRKAADDAGQN